jgi:hypothetical protein
VGAFEFEFGLVGPGVCRDALVARQQDGYSRLASTVVTLSQ